MMIKTISLKLNARKQHIAAFAAHFKICSDFYNHFLQERISAYSENKTSLSCFQQQKSIKDIRDMLDPSRLVHTHLLQYVCKRLDLAYASFFRRVKGRGNPGFPRFKSANRVKSFMFKEHNNGYKIIQKDDFISKIKLTNIGSISVFNKVKLPVNAKFLTGTLSKKADGYYFTLTISYEEENKKVATSKRLPLYPYSNLSHKSVVRSDIGVDVGLKEFLSTSDGDQINCPSLQAEFIKAKRLAKALGNKKKLIKQNIDPKSSRRFRNMQAKLAKQHLKISRIRDDFHHKAANWLIANYENIYIEELNIRRMVKKKFSRDHSRRIHSAGWSRFFSILEYKAANAGIQVQKVPAFWTSQICALCLSPNPKDLKVRTHHCLNCGAIEDRDIMAAKIILLAGTDPAKLSVPKAWLEMVAKATISK